MYNVTSICNVQCYQHIACTMVPASGVYTGTSILRVHWYQQVACTMVPSECMYKGTNIFHVQWYQQIPAAGDGKRTEAKRRTRHGKVASSSFGRRVFFSSPSTPVLPQ